MSAYVRKLKFVNFHKLYNPEIGTEPSVSFDSNRPVFFIKISFNFEPRKARTARMRI